LAGAGPSLEKLLREGWGLADLASSWLRPAVKVDGAGRGMPVMVIPGMLSGDETVRYLRRSLAASGFDPHTSDILFHAVASKDSVARVARKLERIHQENRQKVSLVGWSLGGLYARILAQRHPELVSAVLTLGTPFSGDPRANNAWKLYEKLSGHPVDQSPFPEDIAVKPPVPTIAIWSGEDGIISPASARGLPHESDRQVEVSAHHLDLASNGASVRRIIELLAETLA
jgi:dienelactone hydrolase